MKTENPIIQSIVHPIRSWLALPALAITLTVSSSNLGATGFVSLHDGSWFDAPNTWGQSSNPGFGDDVWITKVVNFDSSTSGQSVTVSNLNLEGGTLNVSGPAMLGMAGTNSYWNNARLGGSLVQLGGLTLAGTNTVGGSGFLSNQGVVYQSANATLNLDWGSHVQNLFGGAYYFQGDGAIVNVGIYYIYFGNQGLLCKRGGSGTSIVGVPLDNSGGTIEVDSGTLSLAAGGTSTDGTFNVASGAVLDLTGGSNPTWAGEVSGSGVGTVSLNSGTLSTSPSLTLDFPDGLFQWSGGWFAGTTINSNVVTISGINTVSMTGIFYNSGLMRHIGAAALGIESNTHFQNLAGGTYDFTGDGNIIGLDNGYPSYFDNFGLLRKSGGTGTSAFANQVWCNNQNGTIEVDSGTLSLAGRGSSSNGTFVVAAGAVFDWTGGNSPTWAGIVKGSGAGTVSLNSGVVYTSPSLTLNLPDGLLQWTGGWFFGSTVNSNVVTISGTNTVSTGWFYNGGLVRHTGTAALAIESNTHFQNLAGGIYDLTGDGSIIQVDCCYPSYFDNFGLLRKSGGTGASATGNNVRFGNQNGTIEVDSGTLSLAAGGSSSNGTFNVASGAVLDLTGGSNPTWAGTVTGSGTGTVSLNSGMVSTSPSLTLNLPDGLLQWTGGWFFGSTVNSNVVTISGTNTASTGWFYNAGLVRHTGTAKLGIESNTHFQNLAGGTYDFTGDGNIIGLDNGYPSYFDNFGLLRKSGGTGASATGNNVWFNNQNGSIEVDSGQLSLNGQSYVQGAGSFIVTLGGTNAGQSGQLLCGPATLGGPLNVKLDGGYMPALGDQFQILSSGNLSGAFSTLNVPGGIAVTYSNNSVFLTVTGTVTGKLVGPALSGKNFSFSVVTVSNQSYTIQRNDNLNTTNWVFYTNFAGDGSLLQLVSPVTNAPQRYFRLRQP